MSPTDILWIWKTIIPSFSTKIFPVKIRHSAPTLLASQIVNVQPMTAFTGNSFKWSQWTDESIIDYIKAHWWTGNSIDFILMDTNIPYKSRVQKVIDFLSASQQIKIIEEFEWIKPRFKWHPTIDFMDM